MKIQFPLFILIIALLLIAGCNSSTTPPKIQPLLTITPSPTYTSYIDSMTKDATPTPRFSEPISSISISTIYMPDKFVTTLNSKFDKYPTEYRYCLLGEQYQKGVLITDIFETKYLIQTTTSILAEECPLSSIGFIHSHPNGNCLLSLDDLTGLKSESFPITGVICELNRIVFYTKQNTWNFLPIYAVKLDSNNKVIQQKDITPKTPCEGEYYCNHKCWEGCFTGIWSCTSQGAICKDDNGIYYPNTIISTNCLNDCIKQYSYQYCLEHTAC